MDNQKPDKEPDVGKSASEGAEPAFELVLTELEEIVERLETGQQPLTESLAAFERGIELARIAEERLDKAEERIEVLVKGASGELGVRPFAEQYPDVDSVPTDDDL